LTRLHWVRSAKTCSQAALIGLLSYIHFGRTGTEMEQQLQAIVTVLSLVNPLICGVERAFEAFARSGVKRTLLESGHLLTNSITSSTRKSRAAGGSSSANS
ncbi:MAG: hypothetical protein WCD25_24060, partial [Pseudolabrys sp.]